MSPEVAVALSPRELAEYFAEIELAEIAHQSLDSNEAYHHGRVVIVTAGPPGAGKSGALHELPLKAVDQSILTKLKTSGSTAPRTKGFPEYRKAMPLTDTYGHVHQRERASHVHRFSTLLADLMRATALIRSDNVVIDGSLSWQPFVAQFVRELLKSIYESATIISFETLKK